MATHLRSSQNRGIIEQCLSDALKKKVRLRIIEGTTLADFDNLQEAQSHGRGQPHGRKRAPRARASSWNRHGRKCRKKITRAYARLEFRQFAQSRAIFMRWAFQVINEAVNSLDYTNESEEAHKRRHGSRIRKVLHCNGSPQHDACLRVFQAA